MSTYKYEFGVINTEKSAKDGSIELVAAEAKQGNDVPCDDVSDVLQQLVALNGVVAGMVRAHGDADPDRIAQEVLLQTPGSSRVAIIAVVQGCPNQKLKGNWSGVRDSELVGCNICRRGWDQVSPRTDYSTRCQCCDIVGRKLCASSDVAHLKLDPVEKEGSRSYRQLRWGGNA